MAESNLLVDPYDMVPPEDGAIWMNDRGTVIMSLDTLEKVVQGTIPLKFKRGRDLDKKEERLTFEVECDKKEKTMTFDEVLYKFKDTFPFAKVDDYRPICHELFTDGKVGITIWLDNGDVIEYYPNESAEVEE